MYLVHTPQYVQALFPGLIWKMSGNRKEIYLTFDDGPIPEVTPWVLDTLRSFDAKATFFCVGDNVRKHPDIYDMVIHAGHTAVSYTHLDVYKRQHLTDIQYGRAPDPFGWVYTRCV